MNAPRQYRAGQSVEDHCRQCHEDRTHTVIVVDGNAQPLRVSCDFCRSEHNFRGGARSAPPPRSADLSAVARSAKVEARVAGAMDTPRATADHNVGAKADHSPQLLQESPMPPADTDLERMIRRVFREETGFTPVAPAEKWRGGQ